MRRKLISAVVGLGFVTATLPAGAGPALVFDADSGRVIYEEDATRPWQPASLTKLMTAYLVFHALKEGRFALNTEIGISPRANAQPPTRFGLGAGKTVPIDLAVRALIIKSANDFAVALAEAVSGSEEDFVADMNAAAARLGMSRTHFINPNGLPALVPAPALAVELQAQPADVAAKADAKTDAKADAAKKAPPPPPIIMVAAPLSQQASTSARDMGLLAQALHREFPEFFPMFSDDEVEIGKRKAHTHNMLLKGFEGADGMKTGFTCGAGYNIVASATRGGRRIIAVVLGEPTGNLRTARAEHLIDHGFEFVGWKMLFDGPTVETLPIEIDERGLPDMASRQYVAKCGGRPDRAALGSTGVTLKPVRHRIAKRSGKR